MLIPAQHEQKVFWHLFENKLFELGYPFNINYDMNGEIKYYASVNKRKNLVHLGLTIDFLCRDRIVKINIYIEDDVELFDLLYKNTEKIENDLGFKPQWICSGVKNPNTRRVINTFPITIGNHLDYERVIQKIIPFIIQYKKVFEKYIPNLCDY